MILMNCFLGC
jgi:hypothetical protein